MTDSLKTVRTRKAPATATKQTVKAAKGQKKNAAGGFGFKVNDMDRAKRFVVLGSEDNYYTPGAELSAQNAKVLIKLAEKDAETSKSLVDMIVEISTEGRAAKQNPAIFALAIAASHGDTESKNYALSQLSAVVRTGTHLFLFANYIEQFRGWGRGLKRAVADWYTSKDVNKAAYQAVKYQSREGWSHRDLFRLSHPTSASAEFKGLGEWILRGTTTEAPRIVQGYAKAHEKNADIPAIVREYGLSWEMIPTESLNDVKVWEALLDGNVPLGALLRQLPRLTRLGVLKPLSASGSKIVARLTDKEEIERARIHPISVLEAMKTYASGSSFRGSSTWTPERKVVDALDKAFYLAFKNIVPAEKRTLIGLDVSGSMGSPVNGDGVLTSREATAAIALTMVATEPLVHTIGFTGGSSGYNYGFGRRASNAFPKAGSGKFGTTVVNLDSAVSAGRRLDDVVRDISNLPFGSTDCSLPMLYALEEGLEVDTFVIMTDNDTWAGNMHPFEALKLYRQKTGIDAKLIVLSTYASRTTIADPSDNGMLDIAGFDSAAPALLADFSRGL
jgi:60 kDa SS-A/Ro ribonucleoprotein